MSQIDPKDARQGKKGTPILIVLVAGLALAVIAFIGMGIYGGTQPGENIGGPEDAGISTESAAPDTSGAPASGATATPGETPAAPSN
jgi:hypothetical protein